MYLGVFMGLWVYKRGELYIKNTLIHSRIHLKYTKNPDVSPLYYKLLSVYECISVWILIFFTYDVKNEE